MKEIKEWTSPWNPFNSVKVLMYPEHLQGMANMDFKPPMFINIDPSNRCNFDCIWCNADDCMKQPKMRDLPTEHMLNIADFAKEWGVSSVCVSGGGEPFMNKGTPALLQHLYDNNIPIGVVCNGSLLNDSNIDLLTKTCRWVGISMDAATPDIYNKVKGIKHKTTPAYKNEIFNTVCENIRKLCAKTKEINSKCDIAYKYLLHPYNANEIYDAITLAKSLGINDFQLRPVGWDNVSKTKQEARISFNDKIDSINNQIARGMELESENFHVYGIRHKFNPDFSRKVTYSKCWASPTCLSFCADGFTYACLDMRGQRKARLCSHYPDVSKVIKIWNSPEHKNLINSFKLEECPRCTFGPYNEIIEEVFINDKMCRKFP